MAHPGAAQKKARDVRALRKITKAVMKEIEKRPDLVPDSPSDFSLRPHVPADRKSDTARL